MYRLKTILALVCFATATSSVFGVVNSQFIYAVGPSFFDEFVFEKYAIPEHWNEYLRVSVAGFQAAWWMGPLLSIPVFVIGFALIENQRRLFSAGWRAIALAFFIALTGSLFGYLLAYAVVPDDLVASEKGYLYASTMWTAVYWSGAVSLPVALWLMFLEGNPAD